MVKFTSIIVFTLCIAYGNGQSLSGQWKGIFTDVSNAQNTWGENQCDYVLDIKVTGHDVTGHSYTYYLDNGKKYYTICKVQGKLSPASGTMEIKEIERTKTNVPSTVLNCFQVHKLSYSASAGEEQLSGEWRPVKGECGYGKTVLIKRVTTGITSIFNKTNPFVSRKNSAISSTVKPSVASKPADAALATPTKPSLGNAVVSATLKPAIVATLPQEKQVPASDLNNLRTGNVKNIVYEKRLSNIIRSINIENNSIKVEIYDNGKIDGDSISVFFNEKLMIVQQMLTEKPIVLTLSLVPGENDLVMYADNLGTIPPNTALMVIRDGDMKYEIGISSDLKQSGTIRFLRK